MKYSEPSIKNRPSPGWISFAAASLLAIAVAGCGGGSDGAPGPAGPPGPSLPGAVSVGNNTVAATSASAAAWKALAPQITVQSVTINSNPVVKFTVTDANGFAVVGLGNKSKATTATVSSLTNVGFTLAKLVPGATAKEPSKWVSYNVIRPPTVTEQTGTMPVTSACNTAKTWCGTYPAVDSQGTLVDNGNGSYTYTFYRDPTQAAAIVAGLNESTDTPQLSKKADLGDVSYAPGLTHRLGIQIGGAAPGTGSNLVNPTTLAPVSSGAPVGVNMVNTGNAVYDFRPDGGAVGLTRNVVKLESCSDCHAGKVLAHGSRKDPNYCVTCHTDQIKFSFNNGNAPATGLTLTGGRNTANTTQQNRAEQAIIDDRAVGNFPNMVHKIHMGAELLKQGYYFNASAEGLFNEFKYPQDQRNCTKCHDGSATAVNQTPNGDNWMNVPSPLACGACHDGIDFATGLGTTLAGGTDHGGLTLDPVGSKNPALCSTCHSASSIAFVHTPVTPPNATNALLVLPTVTGYSANTNAAWLASNSSNRPVGAIKVTYDIKSVAAWVDAGLVKRPQMVFRMLQNDVAVPFKTFDPLVSKATQEIWDNFMGAPSVYFVFAVPQDGISKPADFNASASSYLRSLWNGAATGTSAGTLTGPDASGYYTATLTGVTIPSNATMLTGGLGYTYSLLGTMPLTQTNLSGYAVTASPLAVCTAANTPYPGCLTVDMPNKSGGLIVIAPDVQKVATGYTGRRAIVEDARCNKCHQELGVFTAESFHGGQRNDGTTCAWCHTPNRTSSGWGADSTNFIHAIHGGSKRSTNFTWHAASTTEGFWSIGYPGVLKKCETCHLPGTYDFSASASATALPNKQFRTVGTGIYNNSTTTLTTGCTVSATNTCLPTALSVFSLSPYVLADNTTNYGSGFSVAGATGVATPAAATTLVDSPITTVCFACHDTALAQAHMKANGGSIYEARSTALAKPELCMVCHATGREADIRAMHEK